MRAGWIKGALASLACGGLLAACGGGGGGQGAAPTSGAAPLNFQGTVAIGAALTGATITAACSGGITGVSAPTDSRGQYTVSVKAALPCTLSTTVPTTSVVLRTMATQDGVANISPLTEAMAVFAAADFSRTVAARQQLTTLMRAINSPLAADPVTTPFVADETGLDKNILALTSYVANTSSGSVVTGPGALASLGPVLASVAASCSPEDFHCTMNEMALAKIASPTSKAFARELLKELDKNLFVGGGASLYERSFDPAFHEVVERGYKYGLALIIERLGPSVMSSVGVASSMARVMTASFSDDAVSNLLKVSRSSILEALVASGVKAVVSLVEDAAMPQMTLDGSWKDAWTGLAWGAGSYLLEVAANDALYCTFNRWACSNALGVQLVTLKSEVESLASWAFRDAAMFVDILALGSRVEEERQRNLTLELLLNQYSSFTDPVASGVHSWATVRLMADPLAQPMRSALADAKVQAVAIVGGTSDAEWRRSVLQSHRDRLDRLASRYETMEAKCRALKAAEGQVGISKCLNLFGMNPPAALSCPAGKTLSNGLCTGGAANGPALVSLSFFPAGPARLEVVFDQPMRADYFTIGDYVPTSSVWVSPTRFVITFSSYTPGGTIRLRAEGFVTPDGTPMAADVIYRFPGG